MKSKKTEKYRMEIILYDTIETTIDITKTVYKKKLAELKKQVEETQAGPEEGRAEERVRVFDHPNHTETIYHVSIGMGDIELIADVCKKGYCFV